MTSSSYNSPISFFLIFAMVISAVMAANSTAGRVGINYGRIADDLPSPSQVVKLLQSQGITAAKIYDTDSTVLSAFSKSGISLIVALPNELLSAAASNQSYTDTWIKSNILPFYPATNITAITVGNEVFTNPNNTNYLVPAMKNVYSSLQSNNLHESIKISSPLALSALNSSYPPSAGAFSPALIPSVITPMLEFLRNTSSYLMINAYPFFAYSGNSGQISLPYSLFETNAGVVDSGNGLKYTNLFDAEVDAVYAAMAALQFTDIPVVVTETGWPSNGDQNEVGASSANAAAYNGNLVRHVLSGGGTPLKPNQALEVYLFALFNENQKTGPTSERNYGLFYPSEKKVYDVPLTLTALNGDSALDNTSKIAVPTAPSPSPSSQEAPAPAADIRPGQSWCVANGRVKGEKLQEALNYACGEGGADCRPIQQGSTCYNPDSLEAHASYAFNSYYQKNARATGTCDFGGAAYVVTQAPRYGSCSFPTGN
ncbi:hypothetical protein V2J09_017284 [Rumex salicifolius]